MSVLAEIKDIKIPYPTEGVIRTAQLDDTIAPANSVQLAVNMNFDRVGAMQTRPGVTQYADDLVEAINSFGTLRNSLIPPGYDFIYQLGDTTEISPTAFSDTCAVKISDTKIVVFWKGIDGDGFVRNFEIDQELGTIVPLGTPLEFDTANCTDPSAVLITGSVVLCAWTGSGNDGFVNGFDCSGNTVVAGTPLEFDTSNGQNITVARIDSTHAICFFTTA